MKLTDANVAQLKASTNTWYADTAYRFLLLAVGPTSKTFYAQGRIAGQPSAVRVKLGKFPAMTVPAARRAAAEAMAEMTAGRDPRERRAVVPHANGSPSLRAVLEDYIDYRMKRGRLSAATAKQYRDALALHCADLLDRPVSAITKADMRSLHDRLLNKPYLANQLLRVLRSLFKHAIERLDQDIRDPTRGIDAYPQQTRGGIEDLAAWHAEVMQVASLTRRNFLLIAALTGIRRRNLSALRWAEVDLERRMITIARTKNGTSARLPISKEVVKLLKELLVMGPNEWVFPANSASGHLEEPKEKKVRGTIHHCRHIFTSAGAACGIPEYVLKKLRCDVARTDAMAGYVHDIISHDAVDAIAAHLNGQWSAAA
jgi:integrase